MSLPSVYVLVINWNGREHLEACFESLLRSTYGNARFILIDNGSDDDSAHFVRERFGNDARVEMLSTPRNLGWSGGNNLGIKWAMDAGADYVFLLNNDTATAADAIEHLVETAEANPRIGALAPKMLMFNDPDIINSLGVECSIIGNGWDRGLGRLDRPKWNEPARVLGVCGGAMFLRTVALKRTGLLPVDFGIYLDDLDLCMRMWNARYEVWTCPDAVVRHKFSATMGHGDRVREKYYLNTRNRFRIVLLNFPVLYAPVVAGALVIGEIKAVGRAILDGAYWRIAEHARAWAACAAYVPAAMIERIRRLFRGIGICRFWPLIRKDMLYFPGTEFPDDGWYSERDVAGERLRPISMHAVLETDGMPLRITHANRYPNLGATDILLRQGGEILAELCTMARDTARVNTASGELSLMARHIFDADDTGERADFGGWIRIDPE